MRESFANEKSSMILGCMMIGRTVNMEIKKATA